MLWEHEPYASVSTAFSIEFSQTFTSVSMGAFLSGDPDQCPCKISLDHGASKEPVNP